MTARGHSSPAVTIAIPTYNRADSYFPLALESALTQTYADLEVLVADNCSTDHTADVVARHSDPRLRYFRHATPLKPNDNFNFCVNEARGRFLLLLHDDDLIDADFVEICIDAASERPQIGIIRTGARVIDSKGVVIREAENRAMGLDTADFFLAWFCDRVELYMCNTMYDVAALRRIGGFRSRHNLFQDGIATVTLAAREGRVDVPDVKASFRVHRAELTGAARVRNWCEDSSELLERMCALVPSARVREIRDRGKRFFARINYTRAARTAGLRDRIAAFALVYRFFGYRYLPSIRLMVSGTRLHSRLRRLKRRALGQPEWVAEV
jgi:glycosyltransferase involved in cell wall biosynthesis